MKPSNNRRQDTHDQRPGIHSRWLVLLLCMGMSMTPAFGEYGDVVLNKRSEIEGVKPVVFPHWFHRVRYTCNVCHTELGFKMRAGSNQVLMRDIANGQFCGACHNDQIAWGADRCELCHSGLAGLPSGIFGGSATRGPGKW